MKLLAPDEGKYLAGERFSFGVQPLPGATS